MGDIIVFKAPQNVDNRISFTDIGEKLIAQAFAFGCAFYEARYIHEIHTRGYDFF